MDQQLASLLNFSTIWQCTAELLI